MIAKLFLFTVCFSAPFVIHADMLAVLGGAHSSLDITKGADAREFSPAGEDMLDEVLPSGWWPEVERDTELAAFDPLSGLSSFPPLELNVDQTSTVTVDWLGKNVLQRPAPRTEGTLLFLVGALLLVSAWLFVTAATAR